MAKNGKLSFEELSLYFRQKHLTSADLEVTYAKLNEIKREADAKQAKAHQLRQEVRNHFLPIMLARFQGLDTSKPCAQFLTLMGALIRQSESIAEEEAKKIAGKLTEIALTLTFSSVPRECTPNQTFSNNP